MKHDDIERITAKVKRAQELSRLIRVMLDKEEPGIRDAVVADLLANVAFRALRDTM